MSISVSLENCSSSPLQLGKIEFVSGDSRGELRCKSPEPLKVLWTTGTCCNSAYPVMSFDTPGTRCLSRHFSLIYDCKSKTGLMIGFSTFDRLNTEMVLESTETGLLVSAYSDFNQYMLAPGAMIDSETITFETELDYHSLLVNWTERVRLLYRPIFSAKPAIGWIGGWNYRNAFIGEDSYEQIIRENFEVLKKEFSDYPIKYIWVSIGNLEKDLPGNWLKENAKRFPSGLSALSDDLKEKGYRLGLWVAPFWIPDQHTDLNMIYWDCLLRCKGKPIYFQNAWRIGETGDNPEERTGFYSLDPTHPKAEAFLKKVFTYYKDIGIRYFMLDFLNAGEGPMSNTFMYDEYFDKSLVNGPQVYRKALQIIKEASANDTYMVASTGPTLINTGYVDATRTGPDFGEGREPLPKYPSFYPAACKTDAWTIFRKAINYYATSYHMD
ncbi:MAG TPA: hypothetical protein DDZ89_07385, partial [Clostridiales bacterium]|nr:hypothetical protein [Clostridiales bacterium]